MQLAFLVLAHDQPDNLCRLISRLTAEGDLVVIHWDSKSTLDIIRYLSERLPADSIGNIRFARRVHVEWGGWTMVEATLACLDEVAAAQRPVDYVTLLSGADYPIRPLTHLKEFLRLDPAREYMEFVDPNSDPWVIKGLSKERYEYRHWVNWRRHPKLFDWLWKKQRDFGLKRSMPSGLKAYFGSQWWTLSWKTAREILMRAKQSEIAGFFKTTWVPDEMFFQTLTASIVPIDRIGPFGLTFYHFTPHGRPIVFYNDHFDFLIKQEFFFARKLSPHALMLRDKLDVYLQAEATQPLPKISLRKNVSDYDHFMALSNRGLPNTRVIGKVDDSWYGDLERNRLPYFVILAPDGVDLTDLRKSLNNQANIKCFGELFHPDYIDYDLPGHEHPSYPAEDHLIRDMKRPNFLFDIIHGSPVSFVGCVMRAPPHHEMIDVVTHDPRATILVIMPRLPAPIDESSRLFWESSFYYTVMDDRVNALRKTGKKTIMFDVGGGGLSMDQIKSATEQILERINTAHACAREYETDCI